MKTLSVLVLGGLLAVGFAPAGMSAAVEPNLEASPAASANDRGKTYGPYGTYKAAQAKSIQLQAQGYSTIVSQGHRDYRNWYVYIVD